MVFALEVKVWGALSVVSGKLSNKEPSRLRMAVDERSNLLLLCVCVIVYFPKRHNIAVVSHQLSMIKPALQFWALQSSGNYGTFELHIEGDHIKSGFNAKMNHIWHVLVFRTHSLSLSIAVCVYLVPLCISSKETLGLYNFPVVLARRSGGAHTGSTMLAMFTSELHY